MGIALDIVDADELFSGVSGIKLLTGEIQAVVSSWLCDTELETEAKLEVLLRAVETGELFTDLREQWVGKRFVAYDGEPYELNVSSLYSGF